MSHAMTNATDFGNPGWAARIDIIEYRLRGVVIGYGCFTSLNPFCAVLHQTPKAHAEDESQRRPWPLELNRGRRWKE